MTEGKKRAIYLKYDGHCGYCGKKLHRDTMTVDHIVPVSRGGGNSLENLMPSCRECNEAKAADNLEMLRIHLVWPSLGVTDVQDFKHVRMAANKYKFYFEGHSERTVSMRQPKKRGLGHTPKRPAPKNVAKQSGKRRVTS